MLDEGRAFATNPRLIKNLVGMLIGGVSEHFLSYNELYLAPLVPETLYVFDETPPSVVSKGKPLDSRNLM